MQLLKMHDPYRQLAARVHALEGIDGLLSHLMQSVRVLGSTILASLKVLCNCYNQPLEWRDVHLHTKDPFRGLSTWASTQHAEVLDRDAVCMISSTRALVADLSRLEIRPTSSMVRMDIKRPT